MTATGTPRVALLALALLTLAALPGCDKGMKVGSWQIIDPKPPLEATRIEVERWQLAPRGSAAALAAPATRPASVASATTAPATQPAKPGPARVGLQKMTLDLGTGRASFLDSDGKVYPQQLDAALVNRIRETITSRQWQVSPVGPAKGASNPVYFALTVYNGDVRVPQKGFWSAPLNYTGNLFEDDKVARDQGRWAVPPADALPDGFVLLTDAFDQAARFAHPLSEKVNLIK